MWHHSGYLFIKLKNAGFAENCSPEGWQLKWNPSCCWDVLMRHGRTCFTSFSPWKHAPLPHAGCFRHLKNCFKISLRFAQHLFLFTPKLANVTQGTPYPSIPSLLPYTPLFPCLFCLTSKSGHCCMQFLARYQANGCFRSLNSRSISGEQETSAGGTTYRLTSSSEFLLWCNMTSTSKMAPKFISWVHHQ